MVSFIGINALRGPAGGGKIDFSPMSNALSEFGQTSRQIEATEYQRAQAEEAKRYARGRAAAGDAAAAYERENKAAAAVGSAIQALPENMRPGAWKATLASNPKIAGTLQKHGIDPNDHNAGTSFFVSMARGPVDPLERRHKEAQIQNLEAQASQRSGIDKDSPEARATTARQYGMDPSSDAYRAYVLTGRLPREDQQMLTATDKKAILENDELVGANQAAIRSIQEAKGLNDKSYEGVAASQRAWLANNFAPWATPQAEATVNLDNAVVGNALSQLKTIFGGNPTEGERKILIELQGSSNQPATVRAQIFDRALRAAEARLEINQRNAEQLRGGTYYKPGGGTSAQQPAPSGLGGAPIRAKNPQTGEVIEWNGSQWVPAQ